MSSQCFYYKLNPLGFNLVQRRKSSTITVEGWWAESWSLRSPPKDQPTIIIARNVPAAIGRVMCDLWESRWLTRIMAQIRSYRLQRAELFVTVLLARWSGKVSCMRSNLKPPWFVRFVKCRDPVDVIILTTTNAPYIFSSRSLCSLKREWI